MSAFSFSGDLTYKHSAFDRNLKNSWAWRTPTVVQAAMPIVVMCLIMFFPESPRWLMHKDRTEEALAIFTKYHGEGDPNSPLVQLQYREVLEERRVAVNDNPWWDFRELYNTKARRYRLAMVLGIAFFGQWSGNNVVSYFMVSSLCCSHFVLLILTCVPHRTSRR